MMNMDVRPYQTFKLPLARRVINTFLELFSWDHCLFSFLEVDVTIARQFIEAYKAQTGERLSFTGYLAFCLAQAIDEDKSVQAYQKGRNQIVVFDDVDIGIMIERQIGVTRAPVGHVIRRANHKTFMEIHQEIRTIQTGPAPGRKEVPSWFRFVLVLPGPLAKLFMSLVRVAIRRNPADTWVSMAGTVGITAVGMFGNGAGWGLSLDGYTLWLIIGGIACKPVFAQGRIEPREILSLTVAFDHDIINEAQAGRFIQKLVDLIESGDGLYTADHH